MKDIKNYWEISPPFKGEGQEGTLEWSRSISEHRFKLVPYLLNFINAEAHTNQHILEIGCGSGSDLLEFARVSDNVHGIDITQKAIDTTQSRLSIENLSADLQVYSGKPALPFEDNSMDLVYSYGVLHHTPFMEDILADAHRILKPGGTLKLMLYNTDSILYYYSILYRRWKEQLDISREDMLSKYSEFREGCPHTRCYTVSDMQAMLSYFTQFTAHNDFLVCDEYADRKVCANRQFNVETTGVADIDAFFKRYNTLIANERSAEGLSEYYGWHLLITAQA